MCLLGWGDFGWVPLWISVNGGNVFTVEALKEV